MVLKIPVLFMMAEILLCCIGVVKVPYFLGGINADARNPLKSVDEVLVAELDGAEVAREYMVPVRIVRSLDAIK